MPELSATSTSHEDAAGSWIHNNRWPVASAKRLPFCGGYVKTGVARTGLPRTTEKSPTADGETVPLIHDGKTGEMRQYQRPCSRPVWVTPVPSTLRDTAGLLIFEFDDTSKRYPAAPSAEDQEKETAVSVDVVVNSARDFGVMSVIG